jgi:hypothetical protein
VGADIGFLSQYPGEEEFLMQPLACLEVSLSITELCSESLTAGRCYIHI